MKSIKTLLALPCLLAMQFALAQTDTHLKLSQPYPLAGGKIAFTYDPTGTKVDGKKDIAATVYYLDDQDFPVADIDFRLNGKLLTGELTVPKAAKAFFIKISSDDLIDNNNDKGYVYMVYKGKKPIEGAYASKAFILMGVGSYFAKIKTDYNESITLYNQEFVLYPKSEKEYQSNYYFLAVKNPEYKTLVHEKIISLEKSNDEKDLILAANLLYYSKDIKGSDSINTVVKTNFPNGEVAKNTLLTSLYRSEDVTKKDSLYAIYIKRYPGSTTDKINIKNGLLTELASAYLNKGDIENYHKYADQISNKSGLAEIFNSKALNWAIAGEHLDDAEKLSKQSMDIMAEKINNPVREPYFSPLQLKKNNQRNFDRFSNTYAFILYKQNKFADALKYEQSVIDNNISVDSRVKENYILMLGATAQYAKAMTVAESCLKDNQGTPVMREELKKDYIKVNKSEAGYDQYISSIDTATKQK